MSDKSAIEWTDATWNPVRARDRKTGKVGWHCEHATTGCEFCYAEGLNKWFGTGLDFKPGHRKDIEIFLCEETLSQPLRWKKPRMIFPGSMTDLFADFVSDGWLDRIFAVMALCPQHTFQVLTKRAARMRAYLSAARAHPVGLEALGLTLDAHARDALSTVGAGVILTGDIAHLKAWPLPNVWFGVSTERQPEADDRIWELLRTPAAVRFISCEPALGAVVLHSTWLPCPSCKGRGYYLPNFAANHFVACEECLKLARASGVTILPGQLATPGPRIDWVISGGESGPHARPSNPQWFRDIRDQCAAAGVAYFHKQNGEWVSVSEVAGAGPHFSFPDGRTVRRVGKAKAGRLLDGVEHNGMPELQR